jgi:hypothetical protein
MHVSHVCRPELLRVGADHRRRFQVASTYTRRVPEETILYGTVRDQLETFLASVESAGRSVPSAGRSNAARRQIVQSK